MSDFDTIVLGPDDFVLLRSRKPLSAEEADWLQAQMPAALRGRVLVLEGFDVFTFRPVGAA